MVAKDKVVRVLVLHEAPDEAEQIINALRNIGIATRAEQIYNESEFVEQLKAHPWDLFLARPEADGVAIESFIDHIKLLEKDIPTIVIANTDDSEAVVSCMQAGAKDVVPRGRMERITLVIGRELENLRERRLRRQSESYLQESERRCNLLLESSRDAIAYMTDGMHVHANDSYLETFGYDNVDDLAGMPMLDMVVSKDHEKFKTFLKQYSGKRSITSFHCGGVCLDGEQLNMEMEFSDANYHGEACVQIVIRPIAESAPVAQSLATGTDLLTGLCDRQSFEKQMNSFVEQALNKEKTSSLLFVSVDRFQQLKSNFGIADADLGLTDVAACITEAVAAEEDSLRAGSEENCLPSVIARFSESEFTVIVDNGNSDAVNVLAESIRAKVEDQLSEIQGKTIQLTVSIGVACINESCPGSLEVINRAHRACSEQDDAAIGNKVAFYAPPKMEEADEAEIHERLIKAIDGGQLKILYQPIVSLRGDHRGFYEVLLRMVDDSGAEISPLKFLPNAERAHLSEKIDRWVIVQTLKALSGHIAKGHETRLVINLSSASLRDPGLLSWLSVALRAARVPTDCLIFQFSETDATSYLKHVAQFTQGLKELHCQVSMSHFGGSINPMSALKHLEVDFLKMDPSFTQEIDNEDSREKLRELVTQVHAMDKTTIAPFVESAGVLSTLWQIGISYIQGYYLSPPMDAMEYEFTTDE